MKKRYYTEKESYQFWKHHTMHVKLFSILFCSNFIQEILSAEYDATLAYRQLVVDKNENNK